MISIRHAEIEDLLAIQHCNQQCLPEHYKNNYLVYIMLCWPSLSYVAEDDKGRVIGYIIVKLDENNDKKGLVVSLAVSLSYRRLGIAKKLMNFSIQALIDCYNATEIFLQVRKSNNIAIMFYKVKMNFKEEKIIEEYYADGEDAFLLSKDISDIKIF
ncbi:ARD1 homolog a, N-acetyltransferase [Strongyloides ratti]|uniref:N-terminal amino-acid N(alpha)-acetyltransferase NatA n=1 Tax=Strongyloides ratti TaxID=34506 RepID=A0A1P6D6Y2_STRRB|nr:ARD1 homolog a, N-acetyltransferase [Strongyloides ratti]CEF69437.1 ARD1 homolog a, N-acetyltransferase [Strongyloides ratti]